MKPLRQDLIPWVSRAILGILFVLSLGAMVRQGLIDEIEPLFIGVNALLVSIPLALFFFAIGLLVETVAQHLLTHRISRRAGAALRWTPRAGLLVFALFISLFALDIFGQGYSLWETLAGLAMHLLPTMAILLVAALAWRWPLVGGIAMLLVAAGFVFLFGGRWGEEWSVYLTLVGPQVAIGLLFLADWWLHNEVDGGSGALHGTDVYLTS